MITIGFSSHHVETLPFARSEMGRHEIIVLEEPPSPRFPDMLDGSLSIEDYMLDHDPAFPEFERLMCDLLCEIHSEDEIMVNRLVDQLGFEECGKLFDQIRLEKRERALGVVKRYLGL